MTSQSPRSSYVTQIVLIKPFAHSVSGFFVTSSFVRAAAFGAMFSADHDTPEARGAANIWRFVIS
jgi:hypothetical protein